MRACTLPPRTAKETSSSARTPGNSLVREANSRDVGADMGTEGLDSKTQAGMPVVLQRMPSAFSTASKFSRVMRVPSVRVSRAGSLPSFAQR